jgi:ribosomal protein S18 acetylase RimI-like enzyme
MPSIRLYEPADRSDVAEICLRTGDNGGDATGKFESDDLLADIYALPYVELEPELAFVVDTGARVSGYLLATADTREFVEKYRRHWLPGFAQKYARVEPPESPTDVVVDTGCAPERMLIAELDDYPAHLHIDLLPDLQRQGFGRQLMRTMLAELQRRGVHGVHLGVSPANQPARAFYEKIGFRPLPSDAGTGGLLGIRTDAAV